MREKRVAMFKIASADNVADLMTKPLTSAEIEKHVIGLSMKWEKR